MFFRAEQGLELRVVWLFFHRVIFLTDKHYFDLNSRKITRIDKKFGCGLQSDVISSDGGVSGIQDAAYFGSQILDGEWFVDEVQAVLQYTLVGNDIGCVSGHEQKF